MFRRHWLTAIFAIAAAFVLVTADVHARPLGGLSAGSRGMRTYSAPPSTLTAPGAAPIQRSMAQPSTPFGQTTSGSGFFGSRGLFGGLAGGFLGAGLLGLLFGYGLFGGMAGFSSILGLILQIALIAIVARLIFAWRQRRNMSAASYAAATPGTGTGYGFSGLGGMLNAASRRPAGETLTITKADYDTFERLLSDVQAAYSREDLSVLRAMLTPEMMSYFSEELADNASRGLINRVTDVKLLQGDLAEAWREGHTDYATVAMKFALTDSMVERASGRVVQGGERSQVTEFWTFRRTGGGGNWLLSAIQQT